MRSAESEGEGEGWVWDVGSASQLGRWCCSCGRGALARRRSLNWGLAQLFLSTVCTTTRHDIVDWQTDMLPIIAPVHSALYLLLS